MREIQRLMKMGALSILFSAVTVSADNAQPLYKDGFDTTQSLTENFKLTPPKGWTVKNGKLLGWDKGCSSAKLKKSMEDVDCGLKVDITPQKVKKDFSGIIFRGVKFLIRPDGFWYVYRIKGEKRSKGGLIKAEIKTGETYKFKITSKKVDNSLEFIWLVNGKETAKFTVLGESEDKTFLALFVNKLPMAFDNLVIFKLPN